MYLRKNSPERDVTKYLQNFAENATAVVEAERMDTNFRKFRDLLSTERSPNRSARYLSNTLENRSIKSTPRILPSNLTKASTEMVDEILTRKGLTQKLAQKKSIDRLYKGIVKLERSDSIVGYPHKLDISDIKEFNDQTNHLKYFLNIKHELTGIFETVRGKNSLKLMTKYEMVQFLKAKLKETKENYKGMLMSVLDITKIAAEIIKMIFYLGADEEAQILELL